MARRILFTLLLWTLILGACSISERSPEVPPSDPFTDTTSLNSTGLTSLAVRPSIQIKEYACLRLDRVAHPLYTVFSNY
jgi:hypothetical protein